MKTKKRYELMSKERIVNTFCSIASLGDYEGCKHCLIYESCNSEEGECIGEVAKFLTEELEVAPRYSLIKTDKDFEKLMKEFEKECNRNTCTTCEFCTSGSNGYIWKDRCFGKWLSVEVEKPKDTNK